MKKNITLDSLSINKAQATLNADSNNLNRHFYLKVLAKNDAGWLQPKINNNVILLDGDAGYFPVVLNGPKPCPCYGLLKIPQDNGDINIYCHVERWKDNGDPGGRPYFFFVLFQLVELLENNSYVEITPIIREQANWYGDVYGLTLIINNGLTAEELYKINEKQYADWKVIHGH